MAEKYYRVILAARTPPLPAAEAMALASRAEQTARKISTPSPFGGEEMELENNVYLEPVSPVEVARIEGGAIDIFESLQYLISKTANSGAGNHEQAAGQPS